MGRSRRRARVAAAQQGRAHQAAVAALVVVEPRVLRKTLGAYLAGAIVLAILTLLGTVTLAGALAPWLVLAVDLLLSYGLFRWAQGRLSGLALADEDRLLQTLAGGLLVVVAAFALLAAVVLTVA